MNTKKNNYAIYYSKKVCKELKQRGATEKLLIQLGQRIIEIPRKKKMTVDTSDNMIKVLGYPISFLRDHKGKNVWIAQIWKP